MNRVVESLPDASLDIDNVIKYSGVVVTAFAASLGSASLPIAQHHMLLDSYFVDPVRHCITLPTSGLAAIQTFDQSTSAYVGFARDFIAEFQTLQVDLGQEFSSVLEVHAWDLFEVG